MPRLIDADKLYREIMARCNPYGKPTLDFQSGVAVLDLIDKQQTVDAEPVRHGHWIPDSDDDWYECSSCKCLWITINGTPQDNNMRFCPECGAKMDEEAKDDE